MKRWWQGLAVLVVAGTGMARAADDALVRLTFKAADATQVAAELARVTREPVVLGESVQGKLTLDREVKRSEAVQVVAREALLVARRCLVFCAKGQYEAPTEMAGDKRAGLAYTEDVTLAALAADLAKATAREVRCLPEVEGLRLKLTLAETDLRTVLDTVAVQAECGWTEGWLVTQPSPEQAMAWLREFGGMPADERDNLITSGFGKAMNAYRGMTAADRQATVQAIVGRIDGYAKAYARADQATRDEVKRIVQPLVTKGMGMFVRLDAREQAELMPIVRALGQLR